MLGDGVAFAGVSKYPPGSNARCWAGWRSRPPSREAVLFSPAVAGIASMTGRTNRDLTAHPAADCRSREAMRDVVDPELGINVVDLGLVTG